MSDSIKNDLALVECAPSRKFVAADAAGKAAVNLEALVLAVGAQFFGCLAPDRHPIGYGCWLLLHETSMKHLRPRNTVKAYPSTLDELCNLLAHAVCGALRCLMN